MNKGLNYNTVTELLRTSLHRLMSANELSSFRLVGGTSLSLQLGHRLSVDIDLFSDSEYGSLNFDEIDSYIKREFKYVNTTDHEIIGFGKSYYIGDNEIDIVKLDLFYTDPFIRPVMVQDGVRLASLEDIAAMKIDVVLRGGRKKDFWDIHELCSLIPLAKMLDLHQERYPYIHNRDEIITQLSNFTIADDDYDPQCFKGKYWEVIKLDVMDMAAEL